MAILLNKIVIQCFVGEELSRREKVHMKNKRAIVWTIVFLISVVGLSVPLGYTTIGAEQEDSKIEDGKRLFVKANIAISEERFADAHALADKLISNHAGDYQIGVYLHLYAHTFYLLDEDFRQGQLHPTPTEMQGRIDAMKAKSDKREIDLVKLVMVANGLDGGFGIEYLEEILKKFPESIWSDWAEMELGVAKGPRGVRSGTEEYRAKYRALYNFGKNFMVAHPRTYLMPRLLTATASWGYLSGETKIRQEAVRMCHRVLSEYPSADYQCARARETLRDLLGSEYKESEGCSKEKDRIITLFYCHSPKLHEYKEYTKEYLREMKKGKARTPRENIRPSSEADGGLSVMGVVVGGIGVAIAAGIVLVVLLRKKPRAK